MFTLPPLPYDYNALEPWIDSETMKIHHDKHHQAYVDNLNKALEAFPDLQKMHGTDLLTNLESVPEEIRTKVKNNLGGTMNHNFFWQVMCPTTESAKFNFASSKIGAAINQTFGSLDGFKEKFTATGLARFGSGWVWLVVSNDGVLEIIDTANQDNPISLSKVPVLGLDVWEHAYYLKYQNRRKDYIDAWWNVVNWQEVANRFLETSS